MRDGEHRPVLILDGPGRTVVAIARSLHRHGIPVDAARFRSTATPGLCSRAIRDRLALPDFATGPEAFLAELKRLVEARGYDMVIPASDGALAALQACHPHLAASLPACPNPRVVARVLDKRETLRAASACGVPVPRTWNAAEAGSAALPFPVVVKPASKAREVLFRVRYARSPADLRKLLEAAGSRAGEFLIQEYCPGEGAGVETLLWQGEPVALFQHRRVRENPASGGVSVVAESEPTDPALAEMAVGLLRRLEWSGPAMVEFRRDPATGSAVLMEVNGRYWGSLALPCSLGVEFPYYHWQLAHGMRPSPPPGYPAGARVRWTTGEFMRLKGLARDWLRGAAGPGAFCRETARCVIEALRPGVADAMFAPGDRRPGLAELWFIARRRLGKAGWPSSSG